MSADRITYVGHATALVELGGVRLLTDPMLRRRLLHIARHPPEPDTGVTEEIDAVLLSHLHPDHLDFPSLRSIGADTRVIAPRGGARTLARRGVRAVTELAPGDSTTVGALEVAAVPASHDARRYRIGRHVDALGFVITGGRLAGGRGGEGLAGQQVGGEGLAGAHRVYFAGDTDLFDEMAQIADGGLDVAMLPIAGWGPTVGKGHLDPTRAAEAAAILRPRVAIPIHWGTLFRIGILRRRPHLVERPASRFTAELAELAPGVEPRVLAPGESYELAQLDERSA
ncbi:MAG: MBL fold metallo-hydrolase [Solirubrobacterales bacterium]|nr:MBL fold metallo-hydrolase [Solirubrobacterales bacterium]